MIYFFENIEPFVSESGMKVTPLKVGTLNGQMLYKLSDHWQSEIECKGAVVVQVDLSLIKKTDPFNDRD